MKKYTLASGLLALCLSLFSASAQPHARGGMGGSPQGPSFDSIIAKLFGDNSAFSANMEFQTSGGGNTMSLPGKIAYLDRKSRFEVNLMDAKGSKMPPPEAMEQMKAMGMDNMVTISRPDKQANFIVYPNLQAYAEMAINNQNAPAASDKAKIDITELGKETLDGHPCIKNKVVITDDQGGTHESTVWKATDLKNFPLKIQTMEDDNSVVMVFKDVKLSKPDASLFEAPAGFKHYDDMRTMMMQEMMKKMGGAGGMPPMH